MSESRKQFLSKSRALNESDCVVIAADHLAYDWNRVRNQASLIVDCRNVLGRIS